MTGPRFFEDEIFVCVCFCFSYRCDCSYKDNYSLQLKGVFLASIQLESVSQVAAYTGL